MHYGTHVIQGEIGKKDHEAGWIGDGTRVGIRGVRPIDRDSGVTLRRYISQHISSAGTVARVDTGCRDGCGEAVTTVVDLSRAFAQL